MNGPPRSVPSSLPGEPSEENAAPVIQDYKADLASVRAANPDVRLRVDYDPMLPGDPILIVEYPPPTDDPAGRDVWCDSDHQDWSTGHAIAFRIKPDHAIKLSVSFFDRNHVAYTAWTELQGGVWQPVRVAFDQIRPNPYFQRPDAKLNVPIDVSQVKGIAFAPHDRSSGRLSITKFILSK